MPLLRKIKKHIFLELFNKLFYVIFPFSSSFFLRAFGGWSIVGNKCHIYTPLVFHNTNLKNLKIFDSVHIGRNVTLDLTDRITVESNATISMNCILLTHFNVGESPLKNSNYPSNQAPIVIKTGAYIGANTTILQGVTIGKNSLVGANSLVTKSIPDNSLAFGSPAKIIKEVRE